MDFSFGSGRLPDAGDSGQVGDLVDKVGNVFGRDDDDRVVVVVPVSLLPNGEPAFLIGVDGDGQLAVKND